MSDRVIIKYEPVKLRAEKRLACPVCGKSVRRSTTFEQTHNPFNKNSDGSIKSVADIMREHRSDARVWRESPEVCTKCKSR